MLYLRLFTLMLYSVAFAQADNNTFSSRENFSGDLMIFSLVLASPILVFVCMKIISESKTLIRFAYSLTNQYEQNPSKKMGEVITIKKLESKESTPQKDSNDYNKAA